MEKICRQCAEPFEAKTNAVCCATCRPASLSAARRGKGNGQPCIDGCGDPVGARGARGRCAKCYVAYRQQHPELYPCSIPDCPFPRVSGGLCSTHNNRRIKGLPLVRGSRICADPFCGEPFEPKIDAQIFCDRQCMARIGARRRGGHSGPVVGWICWWCDKPLASKDGRRKYCVGVCTKIAKSLCEARKRYGITRDEYKALYREQAGLCAICEQPERTDRNHLLCVDHDHVTGHVKGLLCSHCNRGIGLFGDSVRTIRRAADYVARTRQLRLIV